jgi:hypothetical protein
MKINYYVLFKKKKILYIYIYIIMGGGLMQLVAYGAQDIYLTGNPQITFFKVVYRRHTNFSMESIKQTANGLGDNQTVTISRNGDLVHKIYIEWTRQSKAVPQSHIPFNRIQRYHEMMGPSNFIKKIECEIGGQLIDRQSGLFIQMYGDLTELNPTGSELSKYNNNILKGGMGNMRIERLSNTSTGKLFGDYTTYWTPLNFWFCRNVGNALPLIALQYHEVKLNVELDMHFLTSITTDGTHTITHEYWVDYIYLDTDERRRFAQVSHEYLIEQVQEQTHNLTLTTAKGNSGTINLVFNHPVKELIWTLQSNFSMDETIVDSMNNVKYNLKRMIGGNLDDDGLTKSGGINLNLSEYQLKLNGHDRFSTMSATYFTRTQVWKNHTGSSLNKARDWQATSANMINRGKSMVTNQWDTDYINVYSFALKPEEHQPSGTCNFSRIDSAVLHYNINWVENSESDYSGNVTNDIRVFAINYNVLRIMSGMGGLAYSN